MSDGIVHVEIPVKDIETDPEFYVDVFGWKLTPVEGMNYVLFTAEGAGISGAFVQPDRVQVGGPIIYIQVDNIEDAMQRIADAGGKPHTDREPVGDAGWFAMFFDPAGNFLGLWQNNPESKTGRSN